MGERQQDIRFNWPNGAFQPPGVWRGGDPRFLAALGQLLDESIRFINNELQKAGVTAETPRDEHVQCFKEALLSKWAWFVLGLYIDHRRSDPWFEPDHLQIYQDFLRAKLSPQPLPTPQTADAPIPAR